MAIIDSKDERIDPDRLYKLLPALYREHDQEKGFPLRSLLRIIASQEEILREDIEHLWDNFFIETCDPWVIPYIGDLVGNNLLHGQERNKSKDTAKELFPDLAGRDLFPETAVRTRADVAKTIYYRRRKGIIQMLEEMARDVTGWGGHAVEFFELMEWTQNLNHLRPNCTECIDLRVSDKVALLDGPFDTSSHTVDVRAIKQSEGWYNIPNIGVFLGRLMSFPIGNVIAKKGKEDWQYCFSPLGNPAPLFMRLLREGDESGLATELHVPSPIRRSLLAEELSLYIQELKKEAAKGSNDLDKSDALRYFPKIYRPFEELPEEKWKWIPSGGSSIFITRNGQPVLPADTSDPKKPRQVLFSCNLKSWPTKPPADNHVFVDVETGRIALGEDMITANDPTTSLEVSYCYGFSANLGGGSYKREKWLVKPDSAILHLKVEKKGSNLIAALNEWENNGRPNAIIHISDNGTYDLPETITLKKGFSLVIEAASGHRPLLCADAKSLLLKIDVDNTTTKSADVKSSFTLSGAILQGFLEIEGDLGSLRLFHSTLVPGGRLSEKGNPFLYKPSLVVKGESAAKETINSDLRVHIAFSISGPLRVSKFIKGLWILDSIIDGLQGTAISAPGPKRKLGRREPGPTAYMERATILGKSYLKSIPLASEVIFSGPVRVMNRQEGCIRFSFAAKNSKVPRLYRCQPQLEIAKQIEAAEKEAKKANKKLSNKAKRKIADNVRGWLVPAFKAVRYGLPYYSQLRLRAPTVIRTGAEDGSEMGAFCHLKQNQREMNLKIRMEEYLPFGLEYGIIYVT